MSTCVTVLAFVFGGFGIWGDVHVPDGKGGIQTYTYTQESKECISPKHGLKWVANNHAGEGSPYAVTYFCQVK